MDHTTQSPRVSPADDLCHAHEPRRNSDGQSSSNTTDQDVYFAAGAAIEQVPLQSTAASGGELVVGILKERVHDDAGQNPELRGTYQLV